MNSLSSLAFYPYIPAAWLRITGGDASGFLQGQFTNELRGLTPAGASYGLWLNQKGKVLADSFVLPGAAAGEFWVGSLFSTAAVIRERLEAYVIADDVVIEDQTAGWAGVALIGGGAGAWLAAEPRLGVTFPGRRTRGESCEWVFPAGHLAAVRARLVAAGMRELSASELDRLRIQAGIPAVPADLGPGELPNEGGLEADAISYTKGCYLGQEVMARLKSMGRVRRRLLRVAGAGEKFPAPPAALFLGARKVGELRSAAPDGAGGFVGLALLSLLPLTPSAVLAFAADGEPTVRLTDAP
jgi:folate-binding protein YgfZ